MIHSTSQCIHPYTHDSIRAYDLSSLMPTSMCTPFMAQRFEGIDAEFKELMKDAATAQPSVVRTTVPISTCTSAWL